VSVRLAVKRDGLADGFRGGWLEPYQWERAWRGCDLDDDGVLGDARTWLGPPPATPPGPTGPRWLTLLLPGNNRPGLPPHGRSRLSGRPAHQISIRADRGHGAVFVRHTYTVSATRRPGPDHPDTLTSLHNLAEVRRKLEGPTLAIARRL
jgi:hypothetical protein